MNVANLTTAAVAHLNEISWRDQTFGTRCFMQPSVPDGGTYRALYVLPTLAHQLG